MKNKYNLLGEKLGHSFSPIIHKEILNKYNDEDTYGLIECQKEDLNKLILDGKKGIYKGFNVTIPYKIEVMKYLDIIDSNALKIGSVNTILFKDNKAIGYNTDYDGFKEEILHYNIDCNNKKAYILGTGGASLSVSVVLKDLGSDVYFVSRNKKGENIISYLELENRNIDILVNTTPVGMWPKIDDIPVNDKILSKSKIVIDIIFNPIKTKLLKASNSNYNGLYMLIAQAIKAEEIWHDNKKLVDVNEIYKKAGEIIHESIR